MTIKIQNPKYVEKEWGYEKWFTNTPEYCTKELGLKKGKRCSLHSHKNKDETFYVAKGKILMEVETKQGIKEEILSVGDVVRITPLIKHRFSGLSDSVIIESSTHHEEEDSYRVEGQLSGDIPKEIKQKYGVKDER